MSSKGSTLVTSAGFSDLVFDQSPTAGDRSPGLLGSRSHFCRARRLLPQPAERRTGAGAGSGKTQWSRRWVEQVGWGRNSSGELLWSLVEVFEILTKGFCLSWGQISFRFFGAFRMFDVDACDSRTITEAEADILHVGPGKHQIWCTKYGAPKSA